MGAFKIMLRSPNNSVNNKAVGLIHACKNTLYTPFGVATVFAFLALCSRLQFLRITNVASVSYVVKFPRFFTPAHNGKNAKTQTTREKVRTVFWWQSV